MLNRVILILAILLIVCIDNALSKSLELTAKDGVTITGTFVKSKNNNKIILLLFHQARSNQYEYETIVPILKKLGFDTLAIDQRSGGKMWDQENQTVLNQGRSTGYLSALPDLQAALDWAHQKKYDQIIGVGSSYSASLIFLLAEKNPKKLTALASFSPGEYLGQPDMVKQAVKQLTIPIYITSASSSVEQERINEVLSLKQDQSNITQYRPVVGIHGVSTVRADRNQTGAKKNLEQFMAFLKRVSNQ